MRELIRDKATSKLRIHMRSSFPLLLAATLFAPATLLAQTTAFTYQSRLNTSDSPANGLYEMNFSLYDAATNGNVVGTPATRV